MRLSRLLTAIVLSLVAIGSAWGQSALLQGGPWKPGHAPMYVGQGSAQPVVQDSGPAGGGGPGVGLSELLVTMRGTGTPPYANQGTGPFGSNICDYDAPTTNPTGYHFLCISPNSNGGGQIIYGAGGAATPLPLSFLINGVSYPIPGNSGPTAAPGIQIGVPGALFNGNSNDTAAINAAINALYVTGGGTLYLQAGTTHSTGINLRSYVNVVGTTGTNIICDAAPCVTQPAGSQLYRGGLTHVHFTAGTSTGAVVSIPSMQYGELGFLQFTGFSVGPLLDFPGAVPTTFDYMPASGNTIFNSFHDLVGYDNATGIPIRINGHFTGTLEDQIFTENQFQNTRFRYTTHCIDIISAADTNDFFSGLCTADANGTTAIMISDDPTRPDTNIGAGANKWVNYSFSVDGSMTNTITYFGGNWTQQNLGYGLTSDAFPPNVTVDAIAHSQGNCWYGGLITGPDDGFFFANTCTTEHQFGTIAYENTKTTFAPTTNGFEFGGAALSAVRYLILSNTMDLASGTIVMPCSPRDGDNFTIAQEGFSITSLQVLSCDTVPAFSVFGPQKGLAPGQTETWQYIAAGPFWVRVDGSADSFANDVNTNTHYLNSSGLPTLSSCGTSPTVGTRSNNQGGSFVLGTGTPASCTVSFADPFPNQAFPILTLASPYTGTFYISGTSANGFVITLGTPTNSVAFNYNVVGN